MNMDELEPECSKECTCYKRQVWNNAKNELKRLREQNEYFRGLLDHYKGKLIEGDD